MTTPITDGHTHMAGGLGHAASVVPASVAHRLERDRAALMGALEKFEGCFDCYECTGTAESALSAARSNFPHTTP